MRITEDLIRIGKMDMKTYLNINRKYLLVLLFSFLALGYSKAQEQGFMLQAPDAVLKGQRFTISYTLINLQPSGDIKLNSGIQGFDVIYGPALQTMQSYQNINGKSSSITAFQYTYTLLANKEGTFSLPGASIQSGGKTYTAKPTQVRVLPPDKNAPQNRPNQAAPQANVVAPSNSNENGVSSKDAFIRAIVSKTKVYDQEALTVTFRFYTTMNVRDVGKIEFPEFNGFLVEDQQMSQYVQFQTERYNDKNYRVTDLRRVLLFPQKTGELSIPSGKIEMLFRVPISRQANTFAGYQPVMTDVKKTLVTNPIKIDVMPLPETNKPTSFSNAVGTFNMTPSISATKVKANDAITLTLNIQGTGNLKVLKTPEIKLPTDFEEYDPKITNNFKYSNNGFVGSKQIEYLFIPRHPGTFTVAPIEFSYFDINTKSYKTLSTPEYTITVEKDPNAANRSGASVYNQSEIKVDNDIRYIKTGTPPTLSVNDYFVGSLCYYLWYIIPALLFIIALYINRKQIKENADLIALRTKRANKVAVKRLKLAANYLSENKKEPFYEEVLRATWGYLSDKLIIPVSELNRDNIEAELNRYGASPQLIAKFIYILDTCEFAQYAPVESDVAMDNIYKETVDAIGEMEKTVNKK